MKKSFLLLFLGLLLATGHWTLVTAVHAGGPGFDASVMTPGNRGYFNTDGADTVFVTVVVASETTTKISGQWVTLYSTRGPLFDTGSGSARVTNANGAATFPINSTIAGELNLYAVCMGETIYPNLLRNSSFESGATTTANYWTGTGGLPLRYARTVCSWVPDGVYGLVHQAGQLLYASQSAAVERSSNYELSAYIRGPYNQPYVDLNDAYGDIDLRVTAANTWTYVSGIWPSTYNLNATVRIIVDTSTFQDTWDCVRLKRTPTVTFMPIDEIPIALPAVSQDLWHLGGIYQTSVYIMGQSISGPFWEPFNDGDRILLYARVPRVWSEFETQIFKVEFNGLGTNGGLWPVMAVAIDDANTQNITVDTYALKDYSTNTFSLGVGLHKLTICLTNGASSDCYLKWIGIGPVKKASESPALSQEEIAIRQEDTYVLPFWEFGTAGNTEGWDTYSGALITGVSGGYLNVTATNTFPALLSPWINVDAATSYYVSFRMKADKGTTGTVQWVRKNIAGPLGERSFDVIADGQWHVYNIDLRPGSSYAYWGNTWNDIISGIVLVPVNAGGAVIQIDWIRVSGSPQGGAEIEINYFGIEGQGRVGESLPLYLKITNTGGEAADFVLASLNLPAGLNIVSGGNTFGLVSLSSSTIFSCMVASSSAISNTAYVTVSGRNFLSETASCTISITARLASDTDYPPVPNTVTTPYDVGVYYFPGFKQGVHWGWDAIRPDYPERKPLLGWYNEGDPPIADWHIKWMAEHGVKFIAYDWYIGTDLNVSLGHAIDSYLVSRYSTYVNFCLLWANHFSGHTHDMLIGVTQYWIDHYFSRPEYYRIGGKPVIIIFTEWQLRSDLGSETAVANVFAEMRQMCVDAGLGGLYLIACVGPDQAQCQAVKASGYDALTAYNWPSSGMTPEEQVANRAPFYKSIFGHKAWWEMVQGFNILPYAPITEPGWDNRPWAGTGALVRYNRNKADYKAMLVNSKAFVDSYSFSGKKIVLAEAWNEFGEGSVVEPCVEFGFGMLDAIREVFVDTLAHTDLVPADIGQTVPQWNFDPGNGPWYSALAKSAIKLSNYTAGNTSITETITFTTSRSDTIVRVAIVYPKGTVVNNASLVSVKIDAIISGTIYAYGETVVFTGSAPDSVSAGTGCTITITGMGNTIKSGNYDALVTTYDSNLLPVDGFTPATFTISPAGFSAAASWLYLQKNVPANAVTKCTVTVFACDPYKNPVSGKTIVITSSRGAGIDTVTQPAAVSDGNGMCTGYVVTSQAGKDTITAAATGETGTIQNVVFRDIAFGIWDFEETRSVFSPDISPYQNNVSIYGNTSETIGYRGAAKYLDGSYDYLSIPDNDSLDPAWEITAELWYKTDIFQYDNWILNKVDGSGTLGYRLGISNGKIGWQIPGSSAWNYHIYSPSDAPLGVWTHVTATYKDNTLAIYVNGQKVNTLYRPETGMRRSTIPLYIGTWGPGNAFFTGCVDELRLYNKALTADEILAGYQGKARPVTFYGVETRLEITTSQPTIKQGNITPMVTFEVRDVLGQVVPTFANTVSISASSSTGKFSQDGLSWSVSNTMTVYASSGFGYFYFRDTASGSPVITVSRAGLAPDSQIVNVQPASASETASFFRLNDSKIPANGTTVSTVTFYIRDNNGTPLYGRQVTIYTSRGPVTDTITQPGLSDANGVCYGSIRSSTAGQDTLSARCEGATVTENILGNPSFEEGLLSPDYWYANIQSGGSWAWDTTSVYSGSRSARVSESPTIEDNFLEARWSGTTYNSIFGVDPGSNFRVYQWLRTDLSSGDAGMRVIWWNGGTYVNENVPETRSGVTSWALLQDSVTAPSTANGFSFRCDNKGVGTAWFDAVRIKRSPTMEFLAAEKLAVITPLRVTLANSASESICIQAQWGSGAKAGAYSGYCVISSSSALGKFSVSKYAPANSWTSSITVKIISGETFVYYKDTLKGSPAITVTSTELAGSSQPGHSVGAGPFSETMSYIVIPRSGYSDGSTLYTVSVYATDYWRNPRGGESVTITTSRKGTAESGYDTITQPFMKTQDSNGKCYGKIISSLAGKDTITAYLAGQPSKRITNTVFSDLGGGAWNLDEGSGSFAVDATGNVNNGTSYNSYWDDGISGKALRFTGDTAKYVTIPDAASLDFSSGLTMEAWVKISGLDWQHNIVRKEFAYQMRRDDTGEGSDLVGFIYSGGWEPRVGSGVAPDSGPNASWYHLVTTYDNNTAANQLKIYVNGVLQNQIYRSGAVNNSADMFYLGGGGMCGWLDDIRVYDSPLTAEEVLAGYQKASKPITFVLPSKLEITTPQRNAKQGNPSSYITVEAQNDTGVRIAVFNNSVTLSCSSTTGRFSQDRVRWSAVNNTFIYLVDGTANFYFMDTAIGTPVITVSRSGLRSDSQPVVVTAAVTSETLSYIRVDYSNVKTPRDGITPCTFTISVRDADLGIPLYGKQVTVYTSRGPGIDTVTQPALTDYNGLCTGAVVSSTAGGDTVFAVCGGVTITENIINNASFEEGAGQYPDGWGVNANTWTWAAGVVYSGAKSMRNFSDAVSDQFLEAQWAGTPYSNRWPIHPSTVFIAKQWTRTSLSSGDARIRIIWWQNSTVLGEEFPVSISGIQPWTLLIEPVTSPANANGIMYRSQNTGLGTAWYDCIRLQRYPMVEFVPAEKFAITTPPRQINAGSYSDSIVVQAQYFNGTKDASYNGTCALSSSSGRGWFALSSTGWGETVPIILKLVSGETYFYYRDTKSGSVVLTATGTGLTSCTQALSVYPGQFSETASFIMMPRTSLAVNTAVCTVTVYVADSYRNPLTGQSVIITTARKGTAQAGYDTLTQPSSLSDTNGMCTGTLVSTLSGYDTVTAYISGDSAKRIENNIFNDISVWATNFDEAQGGYAASISPYGDVASLNGGAAWQEDSRFGSSIYFDGVNAYMQAADRDIYDPSFLTFEMWIKTSVWAGDKQFINRIAGGTEGWRTSVTGNNIYFQIPVTSWSHGLGSSTTFNFGEWSHICGTYDGANMTLYINGGYSGQLARTGGIANSPNSLNIGCYGAGSALFTGNIDEIRIYNQALTADEVRQSYLCGSKPLNFLSYASKLKIVTPARATSAGIKTDTIGIEAQDGAGNKADFSGLADLVSSSSTGRFSLDGVNWGSSNNTQITLTNGSAVFYYIDPSADSPVITVSNAGLMPDSQTENIQPCPVADTTSFLRAGDTAVYWADGITPCVISIWIKDVIGRGLFGKQVTLYTSRGTAFDTITQPQTTDVNGFCTASIISSTAGQDTITALCDGLTVTENIANNPSLENGSVDPDHWYYNTLSGTWSWAPDDYYSGSRSIKHSCAVEGDNFAYINWPDAPIWGRFPVTEGTPYVITQYAKVSGVSDTAVVRIIWWNNGSYVTEGYYGTLGSGPTGWARMSQTVNIPAGANMLEYRAFHAGINTCWFDCARIQRVPTIEFFSGTNLAVVTPARSISAGGVSDSICIQVQFPSGLKDASYNGTCSISATSGMGMFSDKISGGAWNSGNVILNMKDGETVIYYTDAKAGSPVVSASATGLAGCAQAQSVSPLGFSETVSYISISNRFPAANGASSCTVTAVITDYYRNPLLGQNIVITTSRKGTALDVYDTITQPAATGASGTCTGYLVSSYGGLDTVTVYLQGDSLKRVENTVLADSLFGMWNFDEGTGVDAYDLSSYSNNGIIVNPAWVNGYLGPCIAYNGSSVYTNVVSSSFLNPISAISAEAWVRINSSDNYLEIIRKDSCYMLRRTGIGEGDNFNFFVVTGGGWEPRAASVLVPETGPNAPWYHLVGTYDSGAGGNNNKLFVNGILDGSSAKTGSVDVNANDLRIGGLGGMFDGVIDEVRIYGRALTPEEINAGSQRKPKPVTFTGTKLKILTPQRSAAQNVAGNSIAVEARGTDGGRDISFNDTILLSTSSAAGLFSIDDAAWADTTNIYLSSGYAVFYYKDANAGNPVITVTRYSLLVDTQTETITSGVGATQIVITSPQFRIKAGDVSTQVKAVAEDAGGNTDVAFNNTVSLTTVSNSGYFSVSNVSWANTTNITFAAGVGTFYYRDYFVGLPTITAHRAGLTAGTQRETIAITGLQITNTPGFTITSISTAPIMVRARDGLGNTAVNSTDSVTLQSSSLKGKFSLSGTLWSDTTSVSLLAGSLVIYYKDKKGGNSIITVTRTDSWSWSDTQQETITKPIVSTSKVQLNMRSGETGSMPMRFWKTDTVEYTIYISNTGTETSTGNIIIDTKSFDTSTSNPVDYVYMDTAGYADTWAYATDLVSWTAGNPASGASNIKGLRWVINSLGINANKAIRFRVRIK